MDGSQPLQKTIDVVIPAVNEAAGTRASSRRYSRERPVCRTASRSSAWTTAAPTALLRSAELF